MSTHRVSSACLVVVVVACLGAEHVGAVNVRRDDARVLAADGGRLLYRETHWISDGANPERWVLYRCPDGAAFARKRVASTAEPTRPDFTLEDGRDGYREGVRGGSGERSVFVRAPGGEERSRRLETPADGVIDAGFDAAVRRHWPALWRGEAVSLQFLVPSRKRFYPVRVQRVASLERDGVPAERLRMRLDAWFAFAVPDVTLVYSRDEPRLLEFDGTSNVRDQRGRYPHVRIIFDSVTQAATAQEVADARALPLNGGCRF